MRAAIIEVGNKNLLVEFIRSCLSVGATLKHEAKYIGTLPPGKLPRGDFNMESRSVVQLHVFPTNTPCNPFNHLGGYLIEIVDGS